MRLEEGLAQLGLSVSASQREQLLTFIELLHKWNQAFNLTAVRDPNQMISRHLLDSLSILPFLEGDRILDLGTGGGLPGVPLSILCPEKHFYLLDSHTKKQVFLDQVVNLLSLTNVKPIHARVEAYQPEQKFSTIVTRAFATPEKILSLTAHLIEESGVWVAMLGQAVPITLEAGYCLKAMQALYVPGEKAKRHVAIMTKEA
jgi:16S rRNA (guanine527-N7)-methyltransferase